MSARTNISTLSGVLPVPVYTKPAPCGGECIYCPRDPGLPHSYILNEDTNAARQASFSPQAQIERYVQRPDWPGRLRMPVEAIVLGGSFSSLPPLYRDAFVAELHTVLAGRKGDFAKPWTWGDGNLLCSVLTVESRPDQITEGECRRLRRLGVTKVELGVQHLDDSVLGSVRRGHTVQQVEAATALLKDNGFKVGYHVMLGLPGASLQADTAMCVDLLWRPEFHPDYLKVYPCTLLVHPRLQPELQRLYALGDWRPTSDSELLGILNALFAVVPRNVRISRVQRQFARDQVLAGPTRALRPQVRDMGRDVRAREVGRSHFGVDLSALSPLRVQYESIGRDHFIHLEVDDGALVGMARLRLGTLGPVLRELRVFGDAVPVGMRGLIQGRGVGRRLLSHAESLVAELGERSLAVNAGFGAQSFFISCGYRPTIDGFLFKPLATHRLARTA